MEQITNEIINKKFKNQFDLVNYAIALAENMLKTGRDSRVKSSIQNRAMQIYEEILTGKDQFDELPIVEETYSPVVARIDREEKEFSFSDKRRNSSKSHFDSDKPKRGRKILA